MTDPRQPNSNYPFLATVRGHRDIPVRKDGYYFVCRYEVAGGLWWGKRDVTDVRRVVEL